MFSRALLAAIVFVASVVAAPSAATEKSLLPRLAITKKSLLPRAQVLSENWAGSVYHYPTGSVKAVSASFVVPKLSIPSGGSSTTQYSMYALIGIDGVNCASSVFQAGIEMDIKGSQTAYTPFYYFGSVAAGMSGPQISAGDSINVTVTATSKTTGTVLVKNTTKGTSVTQTVTSTTPLCQQDIEWTLQLTGDSISSLPNFTAFKYTNTGATLNSGSSIGSGNGDAFTMVDTTGKTVVSTSLTGGNIVMTHV